jgi:hypothetical protein
MWRASGVNPQRESGAYVTQMLHAKFAYDVRHVARIMQMLRAPAAQQEMLRLDPSVSLKVCPVETNRIYAGD